MPVDVTTSIERTITELWFPAIRGAIDQAVTAELKKLEKAAHQTISNKIGEIAGGVSTQLAHRLSFETMGNELLIRLDLKGKQDD